MEYALVTLLTVMFSPLSFNYAYVWLIYPMTLGLHLVMSEPTGAPGHRMKIAWITAVFLIPALAMPLPLYAQAYGNLFVPALLLLFGLGVMLHKAKSAGPGQTRSIRPGWCMATVFRERRRSWRLVIREDRSHGCRALCRFPTLMNAALEWRESRLRVLVDLFESILRMVSGHHQPSPAPIACSWSCRARNGSDLRFVLSRRASAQVRQVMHAQARGHFAQALSAGREEAAQQPALAELSIRDHQRSALLPEPIEDPG